MMINETKQKWASIIKEDLGVENASKRDWMAQYAINHEIFEGVQAGGNVSNGIYATPLNTIGMGNPLAPQQGAGQYNQTPGSGYGDTGANFHDSNYQVGSGDIPMSTLPIALNIAAVTIGMELVPVVPAAGPWAMLTYLDFPYAGGKEGRINEVLGVDGKGPGAENKPIYIKLNLKLPISTITKDSLQVKDEITLSRTVTIDEVEFTYAFVGTFIGFSRIDGGIILKTVATTSFNAGATIINNESIATVFGENITSIKVGSAAAVSMNQLLKPELVSSFAEHVQGFANFFDGSDDPMTRAQNETGVGNTMGVRMFSKWVQMGAYEVTGTVTRQQLQDMPLYGVDVIGKVLEAMQNQISQSINNRILDRVFRLGVTNAINQKNIQGVDLNLNLSDTAVYLDTFPGFAKFKGINNEAPAASSWSVSPAIMAGTAENFMTFQRRLSSRILAAANLIAQVSRRGRGNWVVCSTKMLSALQDNSLFVVAPMANSLVQDGSQSLYFAGSIAGLNLYVDPYMSWDDNRICVGRKGATDTPGVVFMPYILADKVQTIAEGTMAPKLLINSRYALVDCGFYPEQGYFTFLVNESEGTVL